MKYLLLVFLTSVNSIFAQHVNCSSKEFTISGAVKSLLTINLATLDNFKTVEIPDVTITNHKGEKKSVATGLKGILLKDILQQVSFTTNEPKKLSEFYFIFAGCDGYKVVYSWNEIFNTTTGNNTFIITSKGGVTGSEIKEGILSLTASDIATGRRYIHGLSNITVHRVQ